MNRVDVFDGMIVVLFGFNTAFDVDAEQKFQDFLEFFATSGKYSFLVKEMFADIPLQATFQGSILRIR